MFIFYSSTIKFENKTIMSLEYNFRHNSFILKNVANKCFNHLKIPIIFNNDRSAIISRIGYVKRNEPHISFLMYFRTFFVFNVII